MQLILKPGRERSLERRHPWIFSGSIADVIGSGAPGDTVDILDHRHRLRARGSWSPASTIRCRVWTFDAATSVDESFFHGRLEAALAYRRRLGYSVLPDPHAVRLVNGDADGLPGLVVDRYGAVLVVQLLSVGVEVRRELLVSALREFTTIRDIYERSDTNAREREGMAPRCGVLTGTVPPEHVCIAEGDLRYLVDVMHGHKTGFYLDQRENRALVASRARNRKVLNCFCYTGGFGLSAAAAGATSVMQIDASEPAIEMARANASRNSLNSAEISHVCGDVFRELRTLRDRGSCFDMIILDPPKFADTRGQLAGACRGYKDINLLALKLLSQGGRLLTFSCSGAMSPELFRKVVADAALDAGRDAALVGTLSQADDHPFLLHIPESLYLKGLEVIVR